MFAKVSPTSANWSRQWTPAIHYLGVKYILYNQTFRFLPNFNSVNILRNTYSLAYQLCLFSNVVSFLPELSHRLVKNNGWVTLNQIWYLDGHCLLGCLRAHVLVLSKVKTMNLHKQPHWKLWIIWHYTKHVQESLSVAIELWAATQGVDPDL